MYRKSLLILLLIAAAVAGGTYYGCYTQDKETVQLDAASAADETRQEAAAVTVYVTGAVNKPGVVSIKEGGRAADAVNACGGLLPTADGDKVNMAQILKDGQQLRVPEKQNTSQVQAAANGTKGSPAAGTKTAEGGIVNINTASAEELDTLPGIGPAMAKRIIEYRETEGSFSSVEDIKKVRGIGEAKFQKLRDRICI